MRTREGITGIDFICAIGCTLLFALMWAQNIQHRTEAEIYSQQARDLQNQKAGMYEGAILRGR